MSSFTPGSSDETPLIDAFKDLLGRDPTIGEKANMRRVFSEAYATVTTEMRQLNESKKLQFASLVNPSGMTGMSNRLVV